MKVRRTPVSLVLTLIASLTVAFGVAGVPATGAEPLAEFAPLDRAGPALSASQAELEASLECVDDFDARAAANPTPPVLLLGGTTVSPESNFSWNYVRALDARGIAWCYSTPDSVNVEDIPLRGEFITYGIRTLHERAGRDIALLGHSQGGMVGRWALRFWPDTRAMVSDVIGLAPDNHGTTLFDAQCMLPGACPPAFWQQRSGAEFIRALNSGQETFAGIAYTNIYTNFDQIVLPPTSAVLDGPGDITNIATQAICPLNASEHFVIGTVDPVGGALAFDALTSPGPADPSRISPAVCGQIVMPGVNPLTYLTDLAALMTQFNGLVSEIPPVPAEPPLPCYVFASPPAD